MQIVEFYRGERGNQNGAMLDEIMTWTYGAWEIDHDWVQWLFPSNQPSNLNCDAPVLTQEEAQIFQADPELQEKLKQSMLRFLDFLGFYLVEDDQTGVLIPPLLPTEDRPNPQWWTGTFNHTMLRVTRLLKCLRLTGLEKYAVAFYNTLLANLEVYKFSPNTMMYWRAAINVDLWA